MSDFLTEMAKSSAARASAVASTQPSSLPVRALNRSAFDVIAEVKLQAPSAGVLQSPKDPITAVVAQAKAYEAGGAVAISVLTEPDRFGGSLAHLSAVAEAVELPVMRKDFLVAPSQVHQARAAGASGVLLILAMLDDRTLCACIEAAQSTGMFVLLEAFDAPELQRAAQYVQPNVLLGLNCRDLRRLTVDLDRLQQLADKFPPGVVRVAESGIRQPADAARMAACGYDMALVGTALMQSGNPQRATADMVAAGRSQEARCVSA